MPTGTAVHYVSGTGNDHLDIPRDTGGYRQPHQQTTTKTTGLDWANLAPTCTGCTQKSSTVNTHTGLCATCAPPAKKTELPTEGKQGKPTTRRSAPRARSTSSVPSRMGTPGRAPGAGPSTPREKNPAAAQETRPPSNTAAAGPLDEPDNLDLGRELARAARLLTESADHASPAVHALRGHVLGVLDALEAFLDVTRNRPVATTTEPPRSPRTPPRTRAARTAPRAPRGTAVDETAIVAEYRNGDSAPVIAARHGIWPARVVRILDAHNVVRRDDRTRNSGGRNAKTLDDYDPQLVAEIRRLYVDQEKTTVEVGEATGHSAKFISHLLELAGIPRRPPASVAGRKGRDIKLDDTMRAEICRRYLDGESSITLAAAYDVSCPTILNALRARGVAIRSKAEARVNHLGRDGAVALKALIAQTGATPAQIKVWALREGLIPAIVVGLPPTRVVQAYAEAHPVQDHQEATG